MPNLIPSDMKESQIPVLCSKKLPSSSNKPKYESTEQVFKITNHLFLYCILAEGLYSEKASENLSNNPKPNSDIISLNKTANTCEKTLIR